MALDQWTKKADYPGLPLTGAASFILQGQAYVGFGQSNVSPFLSQAFYAYDPQTDSWTQKANITNGGETNLKPLALVIGAKGYLVHNTGSNDVFGYDPTSDQWTEKADFPGGGRVDATGFTIGGYGYLVGGSAGNAGVVQGDCWQYDTAADQWTLKTGPPIGLYDDVGFSINGKGYVGNDYFFQRLFLAYDPAADQWTYAAPFPGLSSGDAVSFVINDTAFVALGLYSNTISAEVWRFVP
jgi:N-acetylneuraminic acid mutarotase